MRKLYLFKLFDLNTMRSKAFLGIIFLLLSYSNVSAQLAECKDKFLGNIMPSSWRGEVVRSDYSTYWNQVTPENAAKWGSVENSRDNYNWGDLDQMYNYCMDNDFVFKHHVFVWGNQQPSWIGDLSHQEQREELEEWYALFAERYPETQIIDVVNESLPGHAEDIMFREAIGGLNNGASVPYLADNADKYGPYGTGWDYIIYSFAKAREYFPDATLVLNDYNIINNISNINAHLEIVNILKERGLIDAVGIQCHAFSVDNMSSQDIASNLDRLASAGLPVHVTELDIRGDTEQQQRDRYARIFPAFWEHPDVEAVTIWGYVEGQTWEETTGILNSDGSERMAMQWLKEYMASQPDVCTPGAPDVSLTAPERNAAFTIPSEITVTATASDEDGTIETVEFFANGESIGTASDAPYSITWIPASTGNYELTAVATDDQSNQTTSDSRTVMISVPQEPFGGTPHIIPGTIQVEDYDLGGQGKSFNDTDGENEGDATYRDGDGVDIEETEDNTGDYNIGYTMAGEWLEYTVNVTAAGTYDLDIRVAVDGDDRNMHIEMDGEDITGSVTLPNTQGWQSWQTLTVNDVELAAGEQVMRIVIDSDYMNLNYVSFTPVDVNQAPEVSITSPEANTGLQGPVDLTLEATASDEDGSISSVSFYDGTTLLGTDESAPYSYEWINVPTGEHNITAVATDNEGLTTTSPAVSFTITGNIVVRATGTDGSEILELIVDDRVLETWTLGTEYALYHYSGPSAGTFRLNFTNDADGRDVQIDYLEVNGVTYEAEDQQVNTANYANDECGGGEYSEIMHCDGYIEFNVIITGTKEPSSDKKLLVYPNPTSGQVRLPEATDWTLYNALGEYINSGKSETINISAQPSGVYILKVRDKMIRVVKE